MTDFRAHIIEDAENIEWKALLRDGLVIESIKFFRGAYGAGLKEAKDVVEEYRERLNSGEVFNGRNTGVTSYTVNLPDGGTLNVISNALYTSIVYNRVESVNLRADKVPQAIADAVLKYTA